jgi:hypothetical protein
MCVCVCVCVWERERERGNLPVKKARSLIILCTSQDLQLRNRYEEYEQHTVRRHRRRLKVVSLMMHLSCCNITNNDNRNEITFSGIDSYNRLQQFLTSRKRKKKHRRRRPPQRREIVLINEEEETSFFASCLPLTSSSSSQQNNNNEEKFSENMRWCCCYCCCYYLFKLFVWEIKSGYKKTMAYRHKTCDNR